MEASRKTKSVQKGVSIPKGNGSVDQTAPTPTVEQLQKLLMDASTRFERSKAARLHMQLERVRNYVQDIVARFREASQKKRNQLDRKLLLHDAYVESIIRRHKAEVAAYEQKIESLEYAHKQLKKSIQADGEDAIAAEDVAANAILAEENHRSECLEAAASKQQKSYEQEISTLENSFEQHLMKLRERFVKNLGDLGQKYEEQYDKARELLQLREKVEIHEVEERKNLHINELMASHRSAFEQIKAYYIDMTHDNLHLIKELRKEIADLKARAKIRHKQMQETQQENQRLTEPLRQQEQLKCKLEQQLRFYMKDKLALQNIRSRDTQLEESIKAAKQCNHQMEQRKHKLERDIEDSTRRLKILQSDSNLRTRAKIIFYEQKVEKLFGVLGEMYRHRNDLLVKLSVTSTTAAPLDDHLRQGVFTKNDEVATLRLELQKVVKSYQDTVLTLKSRLKELGIDTGSIEVLATPNKDYVSQAPAPYVSTVVPTAKGNLQRAL